MVLTILNNVLLAIVMLTGLYTLRHYVFTLNRLFARQRHPYIDVDSAEWPGVTILIAAHNEERVILKSLESMLQIDYPKGKLEVIVVNDRSKDKTREIVDDMIKKHPGRLSAFHRTQGKPGKAAALKDAMKFVRNEIVIIFDADYIPGKGLIKNLASAFFDPEIGLVMGRVVPHNSFRNLLTRLMELERSGGYQVNQQARMNLGSVPQYGGTVGGFRKAILDSIGGWSDDMLAEDTDLTYRALLRGWKTAYHNRSECYEEAPETWPVRIKQIGRWSKGHNQVFFRYCRSFLFNKKISWIQKMDGMLLLSVYIMPVFFAIGWILLIILFYMNSLQGIGGLIGIFAMMSYSAVGNFAAYFEIAAAVYLDGGKQRIRILPFNLANFLISLVSVVKSILSLGFDKMFTRELVWDKTPRSEIQDNNKVGM